MSLHRLLRSTGTAALALVLAACNGSAPIALSVIAPDGGDPFLDPDGANRVHVVVEDDVTMIPTVETNNGAFQIEVKPSNLNVASRVRVEALRGEAQIGSGATPPMVWSLVEGQRVAVLMHYNDTIIPAPVALAQGRRNFELQRFSDWGFVAFQNVPGAQTDALPSGYTVLQHARLEFAQTVPAVFDGDTAVVEVASSWMLQHGSTAGRFTNSNAAPVQTDVTQPHERTLLLHPTVVNDYRAGGGLLLGGRDVATGAPSNRVDRVSYLMEFDSVPPPALSTPREHPDVITVREQLNSSQLPQYLVAGGQRAVDGSTLLEFYAPGSPELEGHGSVATGDDTIDRRTGSTMVCVARDDQGCSRALLVGGQLSDGTPADSVLIDTGCARDHVVSPATTCPVVMRRGADWLQIPRWNAHAALAEGGMVLVAGGQNASGPVFEIETIDVTSLGDPTFPRPGRILMTYDAADPAVMALTNGEVVIAGGTLMDPMTSAITASTEVWFYRF